jgi:hypothetical protein
MHAAQHRGEDRLRRAGGDGDLGFRVVATPVQSLGLRGDRLAQRRDAGHQRVLIVAGAHRAVHVLDQRRIAVEVREALPEVHRVVLDGERGHRREDRRADAGQLRRKRRPVRAVAHREPS